MRRRKYLCLVKYGALARRKRTKFWSYRSKLLLQFKRFLCSFVCVRGVFVSNGADWCIHVLVASDLVGIIEVFCSFVVDNNETH